MSQRAQAVPLLQLCDLQHTDMFYSTPAAVFSGHPTALAFTYAEFSTATEVACSPMASTILSSESLQAQHRVTSLRYSPLSIHLSKQMPYRRLIHIIHFSCQLDLSVALARSGPQLLCILRKYFAEEFTSIIIISYEPQLSFQPQLTNMGYPSEVLKDFTFTNS